MKLRSILLIAALVFIGQLSHSQSTGTKTSELFRTNRFSATNTLIGVIKPGDTNIGTAQITVSNLLESLKVLPNWPSGVGTLTIEVNGSSVGTLNGLIIATNGGVVGSL